MGNLANLKLLLMPKNQLTGHIPSSIFNMSSLTNMDFSNNSLTGNFPDNMCQHLPALEGLFMSSNQLTGSIPKNLWRCKSLKSVSLSFNRFTGQIPDDIGNLTFVKTLYLGMNDLTGTCTNTIFTSI